ncbi:MAG: hypothetical protein HMLKMBBP_02114 [Planctomycetes bacterium]|nr:hypothetical protein [Planctomycetota bacterium]
MPRIRTIDPEMRRSPVMDGLSVLARLALVLLISEADDDGRMYGDDRSLLTATFPRGLPPDVDERSLLVAVEDLERAGLVIRYEAEARRFLVIRGWKDGQSFCYQVVDRPNDSRLPPPPEGSCPERQRNLRWRNRESRTEAVESPRRRRTLDEPSTSDRRSLDGGSGLDVDRTGRGREADADTDRTGPRASPSPSPAPAGSGSARGRDGRALGPKDVLKSIKPGGGARDAAAHKAGLGQRLRDAFRQLPSNSDACVAVQRALKAESDDDPEFARLANEALLLVQQTSGSIPRQAGDPT